MVDLIRFQKDTVRSYSYATIAVNTIDGNRTAITTRSISMNHSIYIVHPSVTLSI